MSPLNNGLLAFFSFDTLKGLTNDAIAISFLSYSTSWACITSVFFLTKGHTAKYHQLKLETKNIYTQVLFFSPYGGKICLNILFFSIDGILAYLRRFMFGIILLEISRQRTYITALCAPMPISGQKICNGYFEIKSCILGSAI